MTNIWKLNFEEISTWEEAQKEDLLLLNKAKEVRKNAYAKYSNFKVGAAILLDDGTIVVGSNQENAAYPSGLCAERVAIFSAAANYPFSKIIKIAVVAGKDEENTEPVAPCGACRQVLLEYEVKQKQPIVFLFSGVKGKVIKLSTCRDLLPFSFDGSLL